jgi:hypothetical protein
MRRIVGIQLHHSVNLDDASRFAGEFKRYVEGELPWPDETLEGFVPRCTCKDRCLFHDTGRGGPEHCNCDRICGQHGDAEAA